MEYVVSAKRHGSFSAKFHGTFELLKRHGIQLNGSVTQKSFLEFHGTFAVPNGILKKSQILILIHVWNFGMVFFCMFDDILANRHGMSDLVMS